ncbi:MAG: hypothetical protein HOG08_01315, partial [Candidatus Magasanikbacteria bacterium]|nr:hypothetical protein [Candidatus Magasanikbacteria bacterium]
MFSYKNTRVFSVIALSLFVCFEIIVSLGVPQTVSAIPPPPSTIPSDVAIAAGHLEQRTAIEIKKKAEISFGDSMLAAGLGSLIHATSYFTRKLAYDTAVLVAHGGKGQGALAFKKGFGSYLEDTALDSVADGLGELGAPFGLNLCSVPDAQFNIFLQIGIPQLYPSGKGGPQPNCTWQDLKEGGIFDPGAWTERYGTTEGLDRTFSSTVSVSNSSLGVAYGAMARVDQIRAEKKDAAKAERLEGLGFKPLTSLISGNVKTPAQVIKTETDALTAKHKGEVSTQQVAGIYGSASAQILPTALSVFLNTLTSQLLDKLLTEGLFPDGGGGGDSSGSFGDFYAGTFESRKRVERAFTFLFTSIPKIDTQRTIDIITELAACPPDNPGVNNCVINNDLQKILVQANVGKPMTIQEALDVGDLNESMLLISPRTSEHGNREACQNDYLCYSNLQKLRKFRIFPLGLEVAALRSDPDAPWTLGDVVRGFNDCEQDPNDPTKVIPDASFPFCHLINPNWIIRAPSVRCEVEMPGPFLEYSNGSTRRDECLDVSTCISRDSEGNCQDFGYCTKEENIWRIDGDSCPAQYNTCKTYTQTNTNKVGSYLARTLDFEGCNEDTAGCLAYSTEKDGDNWETIDSFAGNLFNYQAVGRNPVAYFKSGALSNNCQSGDDGCHAFISSEIDSDGNYTEEQLNTSNGYLFLKKAPDYLGCYDTNIDLNSPEINWPETEQQARQVLLNNESCTDYAHACVKEEVGCEAFTPLNGGLTIPAIIGEENTCPAQCVGYDSFKREESPFQPAEFPLYFIPDTANSCTAEAAGCSEFTNIELSSAGGEGLEYYTDIIHCEEPTNTNVKTFNTWEGSLRGGYDLQIVQLRQITQADTAYIAYVDTQLPELDIAAQFPVGSPMYANDLPEALAEYLGDCNAESYDRKIKPLDEDGIERVGVVAGVDCHAFNDDQGNVYYRLLEELVHISDQCYSMRKTEAIVSAVSGQDFQPESCTGRRGTWSGVECIRCENNGEYVDGACIYKTVPFASNSCLEQYNGCRAYTGNQAGNIQNLFEDDFEDDFSLETQG